MTADLHTLSGAYVLHALSETERATFEHHLADCGPCALEVRELAATAQRLGTAVAAGPPPALKERVMRQITTVRQEPPDVPRGSRPATSRRGRSLPRLALAACLAAAVLGGSVAVWQYRQAEDAQKQWEAAEQSHEEMLRVLGAPDVRITSGPLPAGATGTLVLSPGEDRAVFVAAGMPVPPAGMVYQLWFDDDGTLRPAGLMDPGDGPRAMVVVMDGPVGGAVGMGITVEPAGGSPQPTSDPLAEMTFPEADS